MVGVCQQLDFSSTTFMVVCRRRAAGMVDKAMALLASHRPSQDFLLADGIHFHAVLFSYLPDCPLAQGCWRWTFRCFTAETGAGVDLGKPWEFKEDMD